MTITHIRRLQLACMAQLTLSALITPFFFYSHWSHGIQELLLLIWLGLLLSGLLLALMILRLSCPVCHNTFVGEHHPRLFTPMCSSCGRSAGDTS